ncbi:MAG TPA: MMPL family transporter [Acidimicrobiales bacterium]
MFARLGTWCHRRRWVVVIAWTLVVIAAGSVVRALGTETRTELELPDVESRRGTEILEEAFGGKGAGATGSVVFRAEAGVHDPEVRAAMTALFDEIESIEGLSVTSPYEPEGVLNVAAEGELAGEVAFAEVELPADITVEEAIEVTDRIRDMVPEVDGVEIYLGGSVFAEFEAPSSEILGLAFAIVILVLAFGSVLAMGLPIGVALAGVGLGSILAGLLSHVVTVPEAGNILGVMIGLGVGIDYALLIVTRYREQLHAGQPVRPAVAVALDTAGRSVLFAGTTVVISLLGMLVMGISFVQGLAVGAAAVVAVTVVASLTLLPALLGFAGERVERTRWRGLIAAGLAAIALAGVGLELAPLTIGAPLAVIVLIAGFWAGPLKREVRHRPPKPRDQTVAYRWSRLIQHRPWTSAVAGALALGVLAIPVFSLRLGFADESNYGEETTTRQAYDLLVEGFGPGFNGPLTLAAQLPDGVDVDALGGLTEALEGDPGVAFVSEPRPNDPEQPTAVMWTLFPTSAPQDAETTDLVERLRDDVLPPAEEAAGVDVKVTGVTAVNVDFSHYLSARLPYFFVAVLSLSFLLLMVVFRSLLVPLKAVLMNLLSIGAAYGIVVALFQWGWLSDLTGVEPAPVEPWMPMMLFAIVFGLSMDYEVFLLSRVREEWHRTGDSRTSVADGLASTARVISAAAAIMVFVFGSFMLEPDRWTKLMGTGLATAVLLDATVIRLLLVPATMELLGDRNWWLPRWLDRILPNLDVEGHAEPVAAEHDEGERQPVASGT